MQQPLKCEPCNKVFTGEACLNQHLLSQKHLKKVACETESTKQSETAVVNLYDQKCSPFSAMRLELACEMCDIYCNSQMQYDQHMTSDKHRKKAQARMTVETKTLPSPVASDMEKSPVCSSSTTQPVALTLGNGSGKDGTLYCSYCDVQSTGPIPYNAHLNSEKHKKKIKALQSSIVSSTVLEQNLFLSSDSIATYSCEVCSKTFSGPAPYKQHMESNNHRKYVLLSENTQYQNTILQLKQGDVVDDGSSSTLNTSEDTDETEHMDLSDYISSNIHDIKIYKLADLKVDIFSPEQKVTFIKPEPMSLDMTVSTRA